MMRHAALAVGLALGAGACKDETAPTPAAAPAASASAKGNPDNAAGDEGRAEGAKTSATHGVGASPADTSPADTSPAGTNPAGTNPAGTQGNRKSRFADLTREVIDNARAAANEPMRLVPDSAGFALQVRLPALLAHPEAKQLWQKAEDSEAGFKQAMDIVRTCLGGLEAVDELVVGFDLDDHLILVGRGKGLGTATTWRCFQKEATARGDSLDLELTGIPRGEGPQLRETDKSPAEASQGYFPNDETFVMVSHEWDEQAQALLKGEGTPAIEGRLAPSTTRAKPDYTVWMVGRWDDAQSKDLPETIRGIEDMALSMNIEDGALLVDLSADAGEASDATRVRERLQSEFDQFKGMLSIFGIPGSVAPKIVFKSEDDRVSLAFTLTSGELEGLRTGIERSF
ncbi:MAG: hypothetical protein AAGF11_23955 [Myxococcota bacterium]